MIEGVTTYSENLGPDVLNGLLTWVDSTKHRGVRNRLGLRGCFSASSSVCCHCPGFVETPCAIGLLTLDEMEPHRERSIAENGHRVGMLAALLAKRTGAEAKFLDLHKDPRGVSNQEGRDMVSPRFLQHRQPSTSR